MVFRQDGGEFGERSLPSGVGDPVDGSKHSRDKLFYSHPGGRRWKRRLELSDSMFNGWHAQHAVIVCPSIPRFKPLPHAVPVAATRGDGRSLTAIDQ